MLFFNTAHHHAEMAGFDHYAHALRLDHFLYRLGDLGGKALLNLQAPRKYFDQPWNLAEPNDFAVWNIRHVHLAEERQHMVLALTEHFDVFHNHHFVVGDGEKRVL